MRSGLGPESREFDPPRSDDDHPSGKRIGERKRAETRSSVAPTCGFESRLLGWSHTPVWTLGLQPVAESGQLRA